MFNTRFVVSFLLFYTKFGFICFALTAGTLSRHFFCLPESAHCGSSIS